MSSKQVTLAGFISYQLVRSEGLLEQQTLRTARAVMTESPPLPSSRRRQSGASTRTYTRTRHVNDNVTSALPPEMGGAACSAARAKRCCICGWSCGCVAGGSYCHR